jgi:hypothetical protein
MRGSYDPEFLAQRGKERRIGARPIAAMEKQQRPSASPLEQLQLDFPELHYIVSKPAPAGRDIHD